MKMNMKPHIWKLLLAAVSMFMAVTAAAQTPPTTDSQTEDRIRGRLMTRRVCPLRALQSYCSTKTPHS